MVYSDEALERRLAETESELNERKESLRGDGANTAREAVCAFANDLPGHGSPGVLFVGVRDDGAPSGLPISDELLRSLADMKTDGNIAPPPTLTVEKHVLRGAEVAVVTVWPSDSPPVRYRGRVWVRTGPRRSLATMLDERILNERRRHRDRPFDVSPVGSASLGDLDLDVFRFRYLPAVVAGDILEANERSLEQQLGSTKMILTAELPTPTVLGLLVVGKLPGDFLPGAYIQFLRIAGADLTAPILDEERYDGPVDEVVRRIEEKLVSHNRVAVDLAGARERRQMLYPEVALQQLVRNAVIHRSYEGTNTPVRVYWYDDRIDIISPGGPFGEVSATNFGEPGIADYRNPNLAEAMRALGLVQRFGAGISIARKALADNGNPRPEFLVTSGYVTATVRHAP
jgi:ATP-dependent DNA helicase RecG